MFSTFSVSTFIVFNIFIPRCFSLPDFSSAFLAVFSCQIISFLANYFPARDYFSVLFFLLANQLNFGWLDGWLAETDAVFLLS